MFVQFKDKRMVKVKQECYLCLVYSSVQCIYPQNMTCLQSQGTGAIKEDKY